MVELNKVYCMDNLELLKQLPDNYIDLIYCDILYGTGRNFGDYQDLKADRKEIEEHYIPRLKEMHRTLKDTGSIYLQMDTRINHWMRCIMDDIFNIKNFESEIIWAFENPSGFKSIANKFVRGHDNILLYNKSKNRIHNKQYKPYKESYIGKNKNGIAITDVWVDIYSMQCQGVNIQSVGYQTQKPKALLERIIKASSNKGDLVADFYMGSGTSVVVAKELNRQFIGCNISQKAVDITNRRLVESINTNKLF